MERIVRTTSVEANGYNRRQLVICGEKAAIEIKPLEDPTEMTIAYRDGQDIYGNKKKRIDLSDYGNKGRYELMLDDFAKMVRKETEGLVFPFDAEYEINLQKLLLQACGGEKSCIQIWKM